MSCPRFSFVLPAYKGRFLAESIKSILAQTVTDFELVIVNDCSPDDIAGIVADNKDVRIRYFENEQNIGGTDLVAQWNKCLSYASGEYVILATDDDIYEPNFLESFVPLIEKYPEVGVFRARTISVNFKGEILSLDKYYSEFLRPEEFFYSYLSGIKGGVPQLIFNRSGLIKFGGFINFPLAWGSDDATMLGMASNGIVHSKESLVRFRWSDLNISGNHRYKIELKKLHARLQLCKWFDSYVNTFDFTNNDVGAFLKHSIVDNINIIKKIFVINALKNISKVHLVDIGYIIHQSSMFSTKDMVSILYHFVLGK